MSKRLIVTIHLPLDMGAVGKILERIGAEYPDATVTPGDDGLSLDVLAEDPPIRSPGFYDGPGSVCGVCGYGASVHRCPEILG